MKKIKYSEITPEKIYNNRRSFIKSIGFSASSIAITSLPFVNNALGKEQDQLTSTKILQLIIIIMSLVLLRVTRTKIHKILKQNLGK